MKNFEIFKNTVEDYLSGNGIEPRYLESLHETSLNSDKQNPRHLYNGIFNPDVVSMDILARHYKVIKGALPDQNPINTADAFLIDRNNEWYFIEFKDCPINNKKDNLLKKAYSNWYMVLDMFYAMMESGNDSLIFDTKNPVRFAKEHVHFIVVCSMDKNPNIYNQIKSHELLHENYTPPFLLRLKDYIFKDVYAFTEEKFEQKFMKSFVF